MRAVAGGLAAALADLGLVPARRRLRVAVHGRRQALLRAAHARQRGGHPALAGALHRHRTSASCGASPPPATITGYCLWAFENAAPTRRPVARAVDRAVRGRRCCATPSTSTPARRPSPRTSSGATGSCRASAWSGSSCSSPGRARCLSDGPRHEVLTGWGRTAPTGGRGRHARRPPTGSPTGCAVAGPRGPDRPRARAARTATRRRTPAASCSLPLPAAIGRLADDGTVRGLGGHQPARPDALPAAAGPVRARHAGHPLRHRRRRHRLRRARQEPPRHRQLRRRTSSPSTWCCRRDGRARSTPEAATPSCSGRPSAAWG